MRKIIFGLSALMAFQVALAQTVTPGNAGFDPTRLARIRPLMQQWVDSNWMNGAVGLIIRNDKIVFYDAVGYKEVDAKTALQRDDIFRIASQTKAITSVAAMILYEEGKFLLDDPVSKYIPAFAKQQVLDHFNSSDTTYTTMPAKRDITIRDLLTHTSGIGYAQIGSPAMNAIYAKARLMAGFYVEHDRLADAMNRLAALPLEHQPGEKWSYGLNSDLLGCLVEIWSGKTLEQFFRERIFEPLGMKDTYFNLPANRASRLVNMYIESGGHFTKQARAFDVDLSYPLKTKTYFSGGAGLSSTAYDYAIFLDMLLHKGIYNGKRILSPASVRLMTMNQIGNLNLDEDKFGLGFRVVTEQSSHRTPSQAGTFGWGGAFTTTYWADPKENMVIVFYRQMWGTHGSDIDEKFRVLAYQALTD